MTEHQARTRKQRKYARWLRRQERLDGQRFFAWDFGLPGGDFTEVVTISIPQSSWSTAATATPLEDLRALRAHAVIGYGRPSIDFYSHVPAMIHELLRYREYVNPLIGSVVNEERKLLHAANSLRYSLMFDEDDFTQVGSHWPGIRVLSHLEFNRRRCRFIAYSGTEITWP